MAELRLIVFNVDQGLCVFARTPTGHGVMIDCGRSGEESSAGGFSPVEWIARNEAPQLTGWNGHKLTKLIITHPHDDHVEDIDKLRALLRPALLLRHKNYDWQAILAPPDGDPSRNTKTYYTWQKTYSFPAKEKPDYGLKLQCFSLSPTEAAAITPNTQHLLNNSSYVTVFTYQPPGQTLAWKVVVAGDNETAGWDALLKKPGFADAIRGADFFVTAHHGHASGFSSELFKVMGKPIFNISSVRSRDPHTYDYDQYALGANFYGENRKHLTTRRDGHIVLSLKDTLQWEYMGTKHEN